MVKLDLTNRIRSNSSATLRSAFTIIEMLIVVTILLLLTTFTAVAIDFTFKAERIGAGARQTQSLLQGARDRAIHAREPRGVRFLLDQDAENGRMVSSMIYVGASTTWSEGTLELKRADFDNDGTVDGGDPRIFMIDGSTETLWANLKNRGYLGINEDWNGNGVRDAGEIDENGNGLLDVDAPRIKIPGDNNGTWYTVITYYLGRNPAFPNRLRLVRPYRDPGTTPVGFVDAFEGTGPQTYKLELPPRILPDSQPVLLPENVVIDLDASDVPGFWRPADSAAGYAVPYASRMDIMFSSHGTVVGSTAAAGLIHLYIGQRDDVFNLTTGSLVNALRRAPVNKGDSPGVPVDPTEDANGNGVLDSGEDKNGDGELNTVVIGDRALVSVVTSTGKITSQPINFTDSDGNGLADDPYLFAETEGQK